MYSYAVEWSSYVGYNLQMKVMIALGAAQILGIGLMRVKFFKVL